MGDVYLSRLTPERIEADMDRVLECGFNLIRLHVHVAPREVYEACDRRGILIWQDFELNWYHDPSPEFEERAVAVQRAMVEQLGGHPSVLTWCCHNEPTALPFLDRNLTEHPTRRLFREVTALDPTRPAFLCSGKQEEDWLHSGDAHAYIGGAHGGHYLDAHGTRRRLVTEFGCEAPLNPETLDESPLLVERLSHVRNRIAEIQAYQAALLKYQIEWYRITRFDPCGGYIQFMLCDAYPQVGCGVLDAARRPKAAYQAAKSASQPVHVMLEHGPDGPVALWAVNDQRRPLVDCLVEWHVSAVSGDAVVTRGSAQVDLPAQRTIRVTLLHWRPDPDKRYRVSLRLLHRGAVIDENRYEDPFHPPPRPDNYPWHFDQRLGMRCYGGRHAASSLKVLNTWYGRLARWFFPVHDWAEAMLAQKPSPRRMAWLKRFFG
jgi:beta-mannosidase